MAERLTPYLRRRILALPVTDRLALQSEILASITGRIEPEKRLTFLCDAMAVVSGTDPREKNRHAEVVTARNIVAFIARREGYTTLEIGDFFGRNHSTITYAVKKVDDYFSSPRAFYNEMNLYENFVNAIQ